MTYPNTVISMPSQLFTTARSFKACSNGKIYIGEVDTDPTIPSNQIQVYLENEDGSTVPVAQPIKINSAGYPVYNGQIAKFIANQAHSMAVYNAYNVQEFYFPDVYKFNPIAPSLEYIDLTTVARANNVNVDQVAYLQTGTVSGILYFYDAATETVYAANPAVSGNITAISSDVDGFVTLTVDGVDVLLIGTENKKSKGSVIHTKDFMSNEQLNSMIKGDLLVSCTSGVQLAIDATPDGGALVISGYDHLIDGELTVTDKAINVISHGSLVFTDDENAKIVFSRSIAYSVDGADLTALPVMGDDTLYLSKPAGMTTPSKYHVCLRSTEVEIVRVGYTAPYYKNETNDIITEDFKLRAPINLTYTDSSLLSVNFYEKAPFIVDINIKGRVLSGANPTKPIVVQFNGYNNYTSKINVDRFDSAKVGTTVSITQCANAKFYDSWCFGGNDPDGDSYSFSNFISSFVTFANCGYIDANGVAKRERGYSARHGYMVAFNNCTFSGIDEHYGWDYFVDNMKFTTRHITICGGSLSVRNCESLHDDALVELRSDAPYANGTLYMENCKGKGLLRSIRPIEGDYTTKRKAWDYITLVDSHTKSDDIPCVELRSYFDRDDKQPTKILTMRNVTHTRLSGSERSVLIVGGNVGFEGTINPYRRVAKVSIDNCEYIDGHTTTGTSDIGNAIRDFQCGDITIKDTKGLSTFQLKSSTLTVKGGDIGRYISSFDCEVSSLIRLDNVTIRPNLNLFYNNGLVNIDLIDCDIQTNIFDISATAGYIRSALGNRVTDLSNYSSVAFDLWNYVRNDVHAGYFGILPQTIPPVTVGASSQIYTTTQLPRADFGNNLLTGINKDSLGLTVNAWVSSVGEISYFFHNPIGNPNGTVSLGASGVILKIIKT